MTLPIVADPIPLLIDREGVVRVSGTRVALDAVIGAFLVGATAEEITQQYPSLSLADIYAVLGYYLRHQDEVKDYLMERRQRASEVCRQNESRFDPTGVRNRLLARRSNHS